MPGNLRLACLYNRNITATRRVYKRAGEALSLLGLVIDNTNAVKEVC
jgi:hypothetical protein